MTARPEIRIEEILKHVRCICYLVQFQDDKVNALIDASIVINAMTSVYTTQIDFAVGSTNVNVQRIDGFWLKTDKIVSARFLL